MIFFVTGALKSGKTLRILLKKIRNQNLVFCSSSVFNLNEASGCHSAFIQCCSQLNLLHFDTRFFGNRTSGSAISARYGPVHNWHLDMSITGSSVVRIRTWRKKVVSHLIWILWEKLFTNKIERGSVMKDKQCGNH